MPARARWCLSIGLTIILLAALRVTVALGRPPQPVPPRLPPPRLDAPGSLSQPAVGPSDLWLLRWYCPDEMTMRRLVYGGVRLILWRRGQAYGLASSRLWSLLADADLEGRILAKGAPEGDYYLTWASPGDVEALRQRYGLVAPLVEEGYYLIGLPPGAALGTYGANFVRRLPYSLAAPPRPSRAVLAPSAPQHAESVVDLVSRDQLSRTIASLQGDESQPSPNAARSRLSLVPGLDAEAAYISAYLQSLGLEVSYLPFVATSYNVGVSRAVSDIVATLPGQRPDSDGFFVVCAHYDSTASKDPGWYEQYPSMPAPGADDNASGTSGVLEVARALVGHRLAYGVHFLLCAGEEQGMQGSRAYAQAQRAAGARILGVINLDMIGYDGNRDGHVELEAGIFAASQAVARALERSMARFAPEIHPEITTADATDISDHSAFWNLGYPAVLVIEDWYDFTPAYHTARDTLSTLDLDYCAGIVRGTVGAICELAQLLEPDLSASQKLGVLGGPLATRLTYTVTLRNRGGLAATATLTDVLAPGLTLVGRPLASAGSATWEAASRVGWHGVIGPGGAVTVTYQAWADPARPGDGWIRSLALLDDGAGRVYELPADVQMPQRYVLSAVRRP